MTRKKPRGSRKVQRRPARRKTNSTLNINDISKAAKTINYLEIDCIVDPKVLAALRKKLSSYPLGKPEVITPATWQTRWRQQYRHRSWLFRCWWRRYVGFRFDKHEKDYDDEDW